MGDTKLRQMWCLRASGAICQKGGEEAASNIWAMRSQIPSKRPAKPKREKASAPDKGSLQIRGRLAGHCKLPSRPPSNRGTGQDPGPPEDGLEPTARLHTSIAPTSLSWTLGPGIPRPWRIQVGPIPRHRPQRVDGAKYQSKRARSLECTHLLISAAV